MRRVDPRAEIDRTGARSCYLATLLAVPNTQVVFLHVIDMPNHIHVVVSYDGEYKRVLLSTLPRPWRGRDRDLVFAHAAPGSILIAFDSSCNRRKILDEDA